MVISPRGVPIGALPSGVTAGDLDVPKLVAGLTISGNHGALVWAAAPGPGRSAVVVTREADLLLGPVVGWFVLASAITIAIGVLVAHRLGRGFARPIQQADDAARRIAGGDLAVRLPEEPGADAELAALARSINAMAEELERSRGLERQFLLSVSHDLRTPLTSIRGYAEAIADGAAEPGRAATVILAEARRLERLVRDLLDLAKLDARRFSLQPETVDLVDVAAGTADGFAPEAAEAGVAITVDAPVPVLVDADPDRLAQVAANLVENALRHARADVWLVVSADGEWAQLAVVDDGPGIGPDDVARVFDRLHARSGLGLAIVRELVGAMGGSVAAGNAEGGGATLTVRLPLSPSSSTSSTTKTTTSSSSTTSNPSTPSPTTTTPS